MVNDYILDKKLNKIKKTIGIKKFDDLKVLIDTNGKLPDNITFKNCLILTSCVIKDNDNFYLQIFLEKALYV